MIEFILFFIAFILIILFIGLAITFLEIPNRIKKQYGEPNYCFITSIIYSPFKNSSCFNPSLRMSAINPAFVFIYNDFMVIKNNRSKWLINKNTFLQYNKPTFFKLCSIKIKEDNIYTSECIEFSHMPKQKLMILENFLKENNFIQ